MRKVYISGPISGYDIKERIATFARCEKWWTDKGFEVFNPLRADDGDHGQTSDGKATPTKEEWVGFMGRDIPEVANSDILCLLSRWKESSGCNIEYWVAKRWGLWLTEEGTKTLALGELVGREGREDEVGV